VQIIYLRNDHKKVMDSLEKGLHAHFAALQQASAASDTSATTDAAQPHTSQEASTSQATAQLGVVETPFAKVDSVVDGSPGDRAGLKMGDTIRNFGGVNWVNHERLSKVAEVVQQNEGVCLSGLEQLLVLFF
jgi:26S proteasome regulatory subunit N4